MKRRLPVLTGLLVLLLIVQSGCVAATEAPLQEPIQQTTVEPTVTASTSDGPPAVQVTVTETVPEATPTPEVSLPVEAAATLFVERPPSLVTPPDKPSLTFPAVPGIAAAATTVSYGHVIGFIFPDGQVALKLAARNSPQLIDENLTVVGAVEIGQNSQSIESGFYQIAIDLESTEPQVRGRLLAGDGGQDVRFERTPLIRNPDRPDSPTFPAISPIISSHGICFVVGQAEVLGKQAQPAIAWFRYCSFTDAGTSEPLLSVRDNFPDQFSELSGRFFDESIPNLTAQNLAPGVQIDFSQTISEIEGHSNLNECIENNECEADIVGAPNASFWSDYDAARAAAGGGNFTVTAGIVRVERVVQIPGQEDVQQGVYWVRDWFDGQENFLGSTLLGVTEQGQVIAGQTIPSAPAYFLDAGDPRTVVSWISAWRLCRWCKWQSNCP